jgi:hypothetical protein
MVRKSSRNIPNRRPVEGVYTRGLRGPNVSRPSPFMRSGWPLVLAP